MNSNTIINPNEVCSFGYWELVYKNELSVIKYIETNPQNYHINCYRYYLYSFISSIYYIHRNTNINIWKSFVEISTNREKYKHRYIHTYMSIAI